MFSQLVIQVAKQAGVTEQLKAGYQIEWIGHMNNIRSAAEEIVNNEIIFD